MLAQLENVLRDRETARGRGRRRAQNVNESAGLDDPEVVHQAPVPLEGHGADAASAGLEIVLRELRDEPLELSEERGVQR